MMRFERAIRIGNPNLVIAAAHELPSPVLLRDALRVLLVLAGADPARYQRAAARFGARLVAERRLSVVEAQGWRSRRCRRSPAGPACWRRGPVRPVVTLARLLLQAKAAACRATGRGCRPTAESH